MSNRLRSAVVLITILLILAIVWSLFQTYQSDGVTSGFSSTLATLALIILTGWYAYSTSNLIEINERQIKAARASSMPALDVTYHETDNGKLSMTIRNRGQGVARNVSILFSIVGRGIDTCQINLSESLPPQYAYYKDGSEGFEFMPRFHTEFTERTLKEILESPEETFEDADLFSAKSTLNTSLSNPPVDIEEDFGLESPVPLDDGDFYEVLEQHKKDRIEAYSPAIYLQVTFTDVMYGETHTETVIDGGYTIPDEPSLNELTKGSHNVKTGITGKIKPFREVHGEIVRGSYPYINNLEVEVNSTEPNH